MKIGFIGTGLMGSRMVQRLLKAGHEVTVYNRTLEKAQPLEKHGAKLAELPSHAARSAEVVFSMLAEPDVVRNVAMDEFGFLEVMDHAALWVDCSTTNPGFARDMENEARKRGVRFVDAPVAGTTVTVENGALMFLCGGEKGDIESLRPLLEAMGNRILHVGKAGQGNALKLLLNHLLATSMAAFAEALTLGEALNIDKDMLLEVLPGSSVAAPFISMKKEKLSTNVFEAQFPLKWMHKDLRMVARSAAEKGAAMPLAAITKELYHLAMRHGLGEEDFSAIYKFISEKEE